jgi:hypothetical protein
MNPWSSYHNDENCGYEGSPLQGPSGARRGSPVFLEISVCDPPRGAPSGEAAHIIIGVRESQCPVFCPKEFDFLRRSFARFRRFWRDPLPRLWHPRFAITRSELVNFE